jgi:hypothetical protein
VRCERRSEETSASDDPRRCRRVVTRDASTMAAMTALGTSDGGPVCPRREPWWRPRLPEARSVVVAATF